MLVRTPLGSVLHPHKTAVVPPAGRWSGAQSCIFSGLKLASVASCLVAVPELADRVTGRVQWLQPLWGKAPKYLPALLL